MPRESWFRAKLGICLYFSLPGATAISSQVRHGVHRSITTGHSSPSILVVARGQAFRSGSGKGNTDGQHGDPSEQRAVVQSLVRFVIEPLRRTGWNVDIGVDAVVRDAVQNGSFNDMVDSELSGVAGRLDRRVSMEANDTQVESFLWTLEWMGQTFNLNAYDAVLILRNDLVFKTELPITLDLLENPNTILVPWQDCWQPLAQSGHRRLMDTFFFIPRNRLWDFWDAVSERAKDVEGTSRFSFLWIDELPEVEPMFTQFRAHASTTATWNFLYRNTGRVQTTDPLPQACQQVGGCRTQAECCAARPVSLDVYPSILLCECEAHGMLKASDAGVKCERRFGKHLGHNNSHWEIKRISKERFWKA